MKAGYGEQFTHDIVKRDDGYAAILWHSARRRHEHPKSGAGNVLDLREIDDEISAAVGHRSEELCLKGFARLSIDAPGSV
jgi:hypothetical protein